jgi:hypothetical protein
MSQRPSSVRSASEPLRASRIGVRRLLEQDETPETRALARMTGRELIANASDARLGRKLIEASGDAILRADVAPADAPTATSVHAENFGVSDAGTRTPNLDAGIAFGYEDMTLLGERDSWAADGASAKIAIRSRDTLVVDEATIASTLRRKAPEEACQELLSRVKERGAPDNVAMVVGRFGGAALLPAASHAIQVNPITGYDASTATGGTRPRTIHRSASDAGALFLHDAALLPNGRFLVALVALGARLLSPDGETLSEFTEPVESIVLPLGCEPSETAGDVWATDSHVAFAVHDGTGVHLHIFDSAGWSTRRPLPRRSERGVASLSS